MHLVPSSEVVKGTPEGITRIRLRFTWGIHNYLKVTRTFRWLILGDVLKVTRTFTWCIHEAYKYTLPLKWQIFERFTYTLPIRWEIRAWFKKTLKFTWEITGRVTGAVVQVFRARR
jgi:hypothetical protein